MKNNLTQVQDSESFWVGAHREALGEARRGPGAPRRLPTPHPLQLVHLALPESHPFYNKLAISKLFF